MWKLATDYESEFDWFEMNRLATPPGTTPVCDVQNAAGGGFEAYVEIGPEPDPRYSMGAGFDKDELRIFAEAVAPFTRDHECVGLVWEGGGDVNQSILFFSDGTSETIPGIDLGPIRVEVGGFYGEKYAPLVGPLEELHQIELLARPLDDQANIDYLWPRSHEWSVCANEDFGANYVGCSAECAEALLASDLEARPVAPDQASLGAT